MKTQEEIGRPPENGFVWNRNADALLNVSATLASGQNFRWRRDAQGIWWGVIGNLAVAMWQAENQPDSAFHWQTFPDANRADIVNDYFRLSVDVDSLYVQWIKAEPRIAEATRHFRGMRILGQPPEECFFAFQCAVCNTVTKIERSVGKLALRYGERLDTGLPAPPFEFFAFPTIDALAHADESALRADLWGYRAPRVIALARHFQNLPPDWLLSLRQIPYADAHTALCGLFGVGAKLADCICLFALDKDSAVPIDTHIRQIAVRLFLPEMDAKSLTPRLYTLFADAFRSRFGASAGWAQQYLFFAELRRSSDFLNC